MTIQINKRGAGAIEAMVPVNCRGCGRLLGVGPSDFRVYCDSSCQLDVPVAPNEARDALISAMFATGRYSYTALGQKFEMSRQRVEQIVTARLYR